MIELDLDVPDRLQGLGDRAAKQVPFALALALNRTDEEAQEAERRHLRRVYRIRRPWVLQGIKIPPGGFATKTRLQVTLQVDPTRGFLTKFEEGGVKRPARGGKAVAIPEPGVQSNKDAVVPNSKRPRSFELKTQRTSTATGITVARGNRGTFLVRYPDGTGGVFQRVSRRGRRRRRMNHFHGPAVDITTRTGRDPDLRLLYLLRPSAQIARSLRFYATTTPVFESRFPVNFEGFFDYALRTAR